MDSRTRNSLIGRGLPTDLIDKIGSNDHTVTNLKGFSKKVLLKFYTEAESDQILKSIHRSPIDDEVLDRLLFLSNEACCYCADGNSASPYQVHHIVEHAATQDDSLENLMLICPTHHTVIPLRKYSVEEQKAQRARWYALAEIDRAYRVRGIPFPYRSFEPINYSSSPTIDEIFLFGPPSPSTARALSEHNLGTSGKKKLEREDFLIIAGESGSGKSTLAMGIAGIIPPNSERVFRYVRSSSSDNRLAVQEILTFVATAANPCTIVIDDINLWATTNDIERIARTTSRTVKVIVTITSELAKETDEPALDRPFPFNRLYVSWDILRPYVVTYLLDHEPQVVAALKRRGDDQTERIGLGALEVQLDHRIQRYENQAKSIWQFLFLLGAGWITIENDLAELVSKDRSDVPVVYAALEQIVDVERAVGATEAAQTIGGLEPGNPVLEADADWVQSVYERLVTDRRVMQRVRHRYTTVHRDWARAFICAALENGQSKGTTTQLLLRDLNLAAPRPRRFARLLSWLKYSTCAEFITSWAKNQEAEDWSQLIEAATVEGLPATAEVASELHLLLYTEDWNETLGKAFETHEAALRNLVINATAEDWHYLQNLFMTLSHARPALAARIIESWNPESAADQLNHTHPDYYDSVRWLLGGSVCKHSNDWCLQVGKHIDWSKIKENLKQIRKGDVQTVGDLLSILHRLAVPIMRSMVRDIADVVHDTLAGASLSDIRMELMIVELEVFPDEMTKVAGALNAQQLALELSNTPPHKWEEMMHLSWMAARAGSSFPQDVVEHLIDDELVAIVQKYAQAHPRTFLPLLWQLKYGRLERRLQLANQLLPAAVVACRHDDKIRDQILRAFARIDQGVAETLARELQVAVPPPDPEDDKADTLNSPILQTADGGAETAEQLLTLERSGGDYDVGEVIYGPDETGSQS